MRNLRQYVEQKNRFGAIFGEQPLVIGVDNQKIADSLDCDLSPENISCDGERAASEVRRLYKFYMSAVQELRQLDPSVKFYEVY